MRDINTLIDGSAIAIQDIVKKLNSGGGINLKKKNYIIKKGNGEYDIRI